MKTRKETSNKWLILVIVVSMTFMATLDSSIVNVALPVMAKELKCSMIAIEWVVASYSIIICGTILFFGKLGDIVGKEKIFQLGCIGFIIGSLLCGISQSFTMLIICRFIQGIGGAAYMANNHGIITEIFEQEQRGKALGILTTAVALGTMIGPPVGGLIVSLLEWHYIFLVNIPIGIVILALSVKVFIKKKIEFNIQHLDVIGAILQCVGMILFFGAFIVSQEKGLENKSVILAVVVSVFLFIIFGIVEKKHSNPLIELGIFPQ